MRTYIYAALAALFALALLCSLPASANPGDAGDACAHGLGGTVACGWGSWCVQTDLGDICAEECDVTGGCPGDLVCDLEGLCVWPCEGPRECDAGMLCDAGICVWPVP